MAALAAAVCDARIRVSLRGRGGGGEGLKAAEEGAEEAVSGGVAPTTELTIPGR